MDVVLIPAYKPNKLLIELLKQIPKKMNIIVIDDGSGDDYESIFAEARKYAHVISYKDNMGKGYALKTGFKYIRDNYLEYAVVTIDADGQHDPDDAIKLINYVHDNDDTLVLGKRTWDMTTPFLSRVGNAITRFVFRLRTGLRIYDTQTGLRAFSHKLMNYALKIDGNRFEYEMNILLNLTNDNIKYHEIPIKTIYFDKNRGSHFKAIKDSFRIYKQIFKYKKTR